MCGDTHPEDRDGMAFKNLREYLAELQRRDLLHVVEDEISKDTELVPLVRLHVLCTCLQEQ